MILGMSLSAFTTLHVIISLIGIGAGIVTVLALCAGRHLPAWAAVFLWTTLLTSVTGFMFPITKIGPPHIVGAIGLLVMVPTLYAIYGAKFAGPWRRIYVVGAVVSVYLNAFVGVVQAFQKIGFLHPLAPNGNEPPFAIAQGLTLLLFVVLGYLGVKRFHPLRTLPM